jgi:hypothetical protein
VNGRVVREYVGAGAPGEAAAAEDRRRRSDAVRRRRELELEASTFAELEQMCSGVQLLVRAWRILG